MSQTAAAVQAQPQKPAEPEHKPHTRLVAAFFVESVPFGGEASSASIGRNVDSILPARLEADGTVSTAAPNQRADGILLRKRHQDLNTRSRVVLQAFVPWANVRALQYGPNGE